MIGDWIIRATIFSFLLLVHVRRKLSLQKIVVRVILLIGLRLTDLYKRITAVFPDPSHKCRLWQCEHGMLVYLWGKRIHIRQDYLVKRSWLCNHHYSALSRVYLRWEHFWWNLSLASRVGLIDDKIIDLLPPPKVEIVAWFVRIYGRKNSQSALRRGWCRRGLLLLTVLAVNLHQSRRWLGSRHRDRINWEWGRCSTCCRCFWVFTTFVHWHRCSFLLFYKFRRRE